MRRRRARRPNTRTKMSLTSLAISFGKYNNFVVRLQAMQVCSIWSKTHVLKGILLIFWKRIQLSVIEAPVCDVTENS